MSIDRKGNSYNSILVIVNCVTKMVYYKLIKVTINIPSLAEVIINMVVQHHGFFDSIISDQGSIFLLTLSSFQLIMSTLTLYKMDILPSKLYPNTTTIRKKSTAMASSFSRSLFPCTFLLVNASLSCAGVPSSGLTWSRTGSIYLFTSLLSLCWLVPRLALDVVEVSLAADQSASKRPLRSFPSCLSAVVCQALLSRVKHYCVGCPDRFSVCIVSNFLSSIAFANIDHLLELGLCFLRSPELSVICSTVGCLL